VSIRLGISVEGQTEERFVKDLLYPHLAGFDVYATPVIVTTSRTAGGQKAKGGGVNVDRVTNELRLLREGYSDGFVTSLYDFYGFGDKHKGETVDALEARIASVLGNPRNLISYVQLHEFEGLLLSNAAIVASYFQAPTLERLVEEAVRRAGSPEQVNDDRETAPSKRLEKWTSRGAPSNYRYSKPTKTLHGPQQAARLSLPVIRAACPRFNAWLTRLEGLAPR
jgi:Domain of unknown function (DUF4276)